MADIKHAFVNPKSDGPDTTITRPSDWNAAHVLNFATVAVDLGIAEQAGTFDITGLSGLTTDKPVLIWMSASPITTKGNARDEAEMDHISATGYVVSATTVRVYWNAPSIVVGTYNFDYLVGG